VKNVPEYANLRVAHGKDRCANPPRSGPQGASAARRSASNGHLSAVEPATNGEGDDMKSDAVFLGGDAEIVEVGAVSMPDTLGMHVDEDQKPVLAAAA